MEPGHIDVSEIVVENPELHLRNTRHDRIMSLHRRAYDLIVTGHIEIDWIELAKRLGLDDLDVIMQFWKTAKSAVKAGMRRDLAFPCIADLDKRKVAGTVDAK